MAILVVWARATLPLGRHVNSPASGREFSREVEMAATIGALIHVLESAAERHGESFT
jgi:hypothetical protein